MNANPNIIIEPCWNDYMNWLSFANAGMLSSRINVDCMNYAIQHLPSQTPIIEIGSFCGLSTNLISYLKEKHGVKNPLVTCDKWIFEGSETTISLGDSKTITHKEYREFIKESYIRNINMFSRYDLPYTIEVFSDEFFNLWKNNTQSQDILGREIQLGGKISFCYIDGNHSYKCAKRDFENCDHYLEKGGFILFDDSADDSNWGVNLLVKEIVNEGKYILLDNTLNYFFQKKGGKNEPAILSFQKTKENQKKEKIRHDICLHYYQLGSLYQKNNQLNEAKKYFSLAFKHSPAPNIEAGYFFHLAEIALAEKKTAKAKKHLKKCLSLIPDHQKAKEHLNQLNQI